MPRASGFSLGRNPLSFAPREPASGRAATPPSEPWFRSKTYWRRLQEPAAFESELRAKLARCDSLTRWRLPPSQRPRATAWGFGAHPEFFGLQRASRHAV